MVAVVVLVVVMAVVVVMVVVVVMAVVIMVMVVVIMVVAIMVIVLAVMVMVKVMVLIVTMAMVMMVVAIMCSPDLPQITLRGLNSGWRFQPRGTVLLWEQHRRHLTPRKCRFFLFVSLHVVADDTNKPL